MPSWLKHSLQLQQHKKDVIVRIYDHDRHFTVDMESLMLMVSPIDMAKK